MDANNGANNSLATTYVVARSDAVCVNVNDSSNNSFSTTYVVAHSDDVDVNAGVSDFSPTPAVVVYND